MHNGSPDVNKRSNLCSRTARAFYFLWESARTKEGQNTLKYRIPALLQHVFFCHVRSILIDFILRPICEKCVHFEWSLNNYVRNV